MRLGGEKTGVQMPNDFDAVAVEGLKITHGINDEVRGVHDTQDGVRNRVVVGAQVIPNQSFKPS
jgi:hypothetical protein